MAREHEEPREPNPTGAVPGEPSGGPSATPGEPSVAAHPSGAPVYGGATTAASRFGGASLEARALKLMANLGRRMTGFAYRRLRALEGHRGDDRQGPAGEPSRAAGAPPPREQHAMHHHRRREMHHPHRRDR